MNKRFLMLLSFAALSMLAFSPANADVVDPFFTEALSNTCPSNCGSVSVGGDPLSGLTTLKFTFNSTIPSVIAGDVEVTEFGSSTVGDLIRFENLGAGPTVAVAFIFSDDIAGSLAADVGLPSSFQANFVTIAEGSNGNTSLYTPTSSQPGFCMTFAGAACSPGVAYELQSTDVPEPASLAIFGSALAAFRRRNLA